MQTFIFRVLPLCLLILPYIFHATLDGAPFYFNKESGALENLTVVLLAIALFVCGSLLQKIATGKIQPAFKRESIIWLTLYCLGCIYFLGEEISWGQHLFDWSTPDTWVQVNDQQETNLHNTYPIFDQIPRALITIGIVVFGFFYPLSSARSRNQESMQPATNSPSLFKHFLPGQHCVISAATVLFISVHDKIYGMFGTEIPEIININDGEVKESLIALFILVYIYEAKHRWKHNGER